MRDRKLDIRVGRNIRDFLRLVIRSECRHNPDWLVGKSAYPACADGTSFSICELIDGSTHRSPGSSRYPGGSIAGSQNAKRSDIVMARRQTIEAKVEYLVRGMQHHVASLTGRA